MAPPPRLFSLPDHVGEGESGISLMRDSFRRAKLRAGGGDSSGSGGALRLDNVRRWCARSRRFSASLESVTIAGGRIVHIGPAGAAAGAAAAAGVADDSSSAAAAGAATAKSTASHVVAAAIDCGGAFLLPGLCDAHVHVTAVTADLAGLRSMPESLVTAGAAEVLGGMLLRGFTAVRDCGGADFGLAAAVDSGQVLGPRVLFTGHALSQTGGHGDMRGAGEDACACGAALRGIGRVCDGVGECRRGARDELRRGAHCIKVMASGGVASPTDRLTNTQFSLEELRAIVEEAEAAGTYVCAHAYTPAAIQRALRCGVRSIEHGNWLDEETALMMAKQGAFLVPTTVTYDALRRDGVRAGMPAALVAKVADAVERGVSAIALARRCGVRMAFGSDLLGQLHARQCDEFGLRARAGVPPGELIAAATSEAAALFGLQDEMGAIEPGFRADLALYASDPSAAAAAAPADGASDGPSAEAGDGGNSSSSSSGEGRQQQRAPAALADPARWLQLVVKDGLVAAAPGGDGAGAPFATINALLA